MVNKKLVDQLAAGEIAIVTTPETMHLARQVLKAAFPKDAYLDHGNIKPNWTYRAACHDNIFCVDGNPDGLKEVLVKDFLQSDPKFQKGDKVRIIDQKDEWLIRTAIQHPETGNWAYLLEKGMYTMNVSEYRLEPVIDPTYVIGEEYEFSNDFGFSPTEPSWFKHKLIGIVDHAFKYIVDGDCPLSFRCIREIQPKEVTIELWMNIYPNGTYFKNEVYRSKEIAEGRAIGSEIQVKLTGTYTI